MLNPMTEREKELTIKNIISAIKDIEKLNKRGYNHLYLMSGFIAHYNIHGFIDNYRQTSLRDEIVDSIKGYNYDNFNNYDKDWEYYKQKIDLNKRLLAELIKPEYDNLPLKAGFCKTCGQRVS